MSKIVWDEKAKRQLLLAQMRSGISTWLEEMRQYSEEIESCLRKKIKQYESLIRSEEDIIDKQQLEMFSELYRSSLFITCYSFFEFELSIICNDFYNRNNLAIRFDYRYRRGTGLSNFQRMIHYLINVCNLALLNNSKAVPKILIYNKLRNTIVHNAGRLVFNYQELKTFITDNEPKITLNNYDLIIFTETFLFDAINTYDSFFEEFFGAFSSWIA